jgi:hypothetical protein
MIATRYVVSGHTPYEQVYIQYGPVWLFYQWLLYGWLGVPISHDAVRLNSLIHWLIIASLGGFFIFRATHSSLLAGAAYIMTLLHLDRFAAEPGHPQEVCTILILLALVLSTFLEIPYRRSRVVTVLGAIVAAVSLVKANVGIYLCISTLLLLLSASGRSGVLAIFYSLVAGVALLLPLGLMRTRLMEGRAVMYYMVATLSMIPVLSSSRGFSCVASFRPREMLIFLGAMAASIAAICIFAGSYSLSTGDLVYGMIEQHKQIAEAFYVSIGMPPLVGIVAMIAFLSYFLLRQWSSDSSLKGRPIVIFSWLKLIFAITVLGAASSAYWAEAQIPLTDILQFRGHSDLLLMYATPFLWVVLMPPGGSQTSPGDGLCRRMICLVAALQILQVFPIVGSQIVPATFPILLSAVICLSDGMNALVHYYCSDMCAAKIRFGSYLSLLFLVLTLLLHRGWGSYKHFKNLVPLRLPGAESVRMAKDEVAIYRRLVLNLQSNCDTFLSFPAMNSLYFWTQISPPTAFNATWWPRMLEQEQQRKILASLEAYDRVCFLYDTRHEMRRNDLDRSPLLTYLQQNFHSVGSIGPFELRGRNGRHFPLILQ